MYKYIYHISDLHITSIQNNKTNLSTSNNFNELTNAINQFIKQIEDPEHSLIVITGDIFHYINKINSYILVYFEDIIKKLTDICKVVMIFGNHDVSPHNEENDIKILFTKIIKKSNNRLYILSEEKEYEFDNIIFIPTLFYSDTIKQVKSKNPNKIYISLYHNEIYGCQMKSPTCFKDNVLPEECTVPNARRAFGTLEGESAQWADSPYISKFKIKKTDFKEYDLILLGHIHCHQFLQPNMAYPGSLIQTNFGEEINDQGYIKWNLETKTGEFIKLEQDTSYISISDTDYETYNYPKNSYIRLMLTTTNKTPQEIQSYISKKTNILLFTQSYQYSTVKSKMNSIQKKLVLTCDKDLIKIIRNALINNYKEKENKEKENEEKGLIDFDDLNENSEQENDKNQENNQENNFNILKDSTKQEINSIIEIFTKLLTDINFSYNISPKTFKLNDLRFNNLMAYGKDNQIRFNNFDGIIGLVAPNHSGKSSIIDILLFSIYKKIIRGRANDIINVKHLSDSFNSIVNFNVNNDNYEITRFGQKVKSSYPKKVQIMKNEKLQNILTENDDLEFIENKVCSYDDFISSSIILQQNQGFLDLSPKDKRDTIFSIFNLNIFDEIMRLLYKYKKDSGILVKDKKKSILSFNTQHPEINGKNINELEDINQDITKEIQDISTQITSKSSLIVPQSNDIELGKSMTKEEYDKSIKNLTTIKHNIKIYKNKKIEKQDELNKYLLENHTTKDNFNYDISEEEYNNLPDLIKDLEQKKEKEQSKINEIDIIINSFKPKYNNYNGIDLVSLDEYNKLDNYLKEFIKTKEEFIVKLNEIKAYLSFNKKLDKKHNIKITDEEHNENLKKLVELEDKLNKVNKEYLEYMDSYNTKLQLLNTLKKQLLSCKLNNVKKYNLNQGIINIKNYEFNPELDKYYNINKNIIKDIDDYIRIASLNNMDINCKYCRMNNKDKLSKIKTELLNLPKDELRNNMKICEEFMKLIQNYKINSFSINLDEYKVFIKDNEEINENINEKEKDIENNIEKNIENKQVSEKEKDTENNIENNIENNQVSENINNTENNQVSYTENNIKDIKNKQNQYQTKSLNVLLNFDYYHNKNIDNQIDLIQNSINKLIQNNKEFEYKDTINKINQQVYKLNEQIEIYNNSVYYLKLEEQEKINKDIEHINDQIENINKMKEYFEYYNIQEMKTTKETILNTIKDYDEQIIISKNKIQSFINKGYNKINNELKEINNNIIIRKQKIETITKNQNKYIYDRNEKLKKEIKQLEHNKLCKENNIKNNERIISYLELLDTMNTELIDYEQKLKYYTILEELFKEHGIISNIIGSLLKTIENEVNNILNELAGFSIKIEYDIKYGINIYRKLNNDVQISAAQMSGFEKEVVNIIFKVILNKLNTKFTSNFLIIDEGFTSYDQQHLNNMNQLITLLKNNYKFVLVISHIDTLKDYFDRMIEIEVNQDSYINV